MMAFVNPNSYFGTALHETITFLPGGFSQYSGIQVWADDGYDTISLPFHSATINGGAGYDSLNLSATPFPLVVELAGLVYKKSEYFLDGAKEDQFSNPTSTDSIWFGGIEKITTTQFNDVVFGTYGLNPIHVFLGDGIDKYNGGIGNDWVYGGSGVDFLNGNHGDDVLSGGPGIDFIHGESDNDKLYGGDDTDYLFGGADNDTVKGGGGDDRITGGTGVDKLWGGSGADLFVFRSRLDTGDIYRDRADTIFDFELIDIIEIPSGLEFADRGDTPSLGEYSVWEHEGAHVITWLNSDGSWSDIRVFGADPLGNIIA